MNLRLYDYAASANCFKVRLLLAQLERPHERVAVDIFDGDTLTDEYARINPFRSTPVLELEPDRHLIESNAILVYLADGTALLPDGPAERSEVVRWLIYEQTDVMPAIGGLRFRLQTGRLALEDEAVIGGDVLYKASSEARVDPASAVNGRLTRRDVITPVWAKVASRLFVVFSLLGFVVAGLLAAWVFRGWSSRALTAAEQRPGRSAVIGLGILLVPPILVLPLFLTLVGIPVALVILIAWVCALFLGPLPAVTAAGKRLLRGRGGVAAALVVGTVLWRGAMWLLPLIALLLYLAALLVGLGAYGAAAWSLRREHPA